MVARRQAGFDAVPHHQNGGEGPEQVLSHPVEDSKILLHERVDRLQHCVKEVHGFSVSSCSGPRVLREPIAAEALGQVAVEGSEILGHLLPHLHGEVEVRGVGVSLLFRLENLLLKRCDAEVVCVL